MGGLGGVYITRLSIIALATCACSRSPAVPQEKVSSPPRALSDAEGQRARQEASEKEEKQQEQAPTPSPAQAPTQSVSSAPDGLKCLARAYAGVAAEEDGQWWLSWRDGTRLPWRERDAEAHRVQKSQHAFPPSSLENMMAQPYSVGPISPVNAPQWDPGRVRSEKLFAHLYGDTAAKVRGELELVPFLGSQVSVHKKIRPALERVSARLAKLVENSPPIRPWLTNLGGTFNWRTIAGTKRRSAHSWGIAFDLNPARADYWRNAGPNPAWKNHVPESIVFAFEAEGFLWGGRWNHFDTMHFEYRPELLDPECQAPTPFRPSWELSREEFESLESRFPEPPGTQRDSVHKASFGAFLRNLPLLPSGTKVLSHSGDTILDSSDRRLSAVVDLDVGARDLQQCADSVIRLHAEWAFSASKSPIEYRAGNGARFDFQRYLSGERFRAQGNKLVSRHSAAAQVRSHTALRSFLDTVFNWVNTGALAHYSQQVAIDQIQAGDFFVLSGSPYGHAVLVLDIARNAKGKPLLLLGQGYMPAQSFHVLRSPTGSPWFELDTQAGQIKTPFWSPFPFNSLRRFSTPTQIQ